MKSMLPLVLAKLAWTTEAIILSFVGIVLFLVWIFS